MKTETKVALDITTHSIVVIDETLHMADRDIFLNACLSLDEGGWLIREERIGERLNIEGFLPSTIQKLIEDTLLNELKSFCSYPLNTPFIIVDLRGRADVNLLIRISSLAESLHYGVNYLKSVEGSRIDPARIFSSRSVTLLKRQSTLRHMLMVDREVSYIFGDIHGCFHTFKNALEQIFETTIRDEHSFISTRHTNRIIILTGDVVDKGPFGKEILQLCLNNTHRIKWVLGNHEQFINSSLQNRHGGVKGLSPEITKTYFTSLAQYKGDEEFKNLLDQYVEHSYPFIATSTYIVTHAPCEEKYLGKLDKISIRKQLNILLKSDASKGDAEELLSFVKEQADSRLPYHFFGHIATKESIRIANKIGLDTSAVHANKLTYAITNSRELKEVELISLPTDEKDLVRGSFKAIEPFYTLFDGITKELSTSSSLKDTTLLIDKPTRVIPPVMSLPMLESESLRDGINKCFNYYTNRGVEKVRIVESYLSNKVTLYLHPMLSDCYITDANGNLVTELHKRKGSITNLRNFFKLVKEQLQMKSGSAVVEGALLPWRALGEVALTLPALEESWHSTGANKNFNRILKTGENRSNVEFVPERVVSSSGDLKRIASIIGHINSISIIEQTKYDYLLVEPYDYSLQELERKSAPVALAVFKTKDLQDLAAMLDNRLSTNRPVDESIRINLRLALVNEDSAQLENIALARYYRNLLTNTN